MKQESQKILENFEKKPKTSGYHPKEWNGKKGKSKYSLVFMPIFNEGEKVIDLINEIRSICDFPVLVVNDGSDRDTTAAIRRSKPDYVIEHSHNLGPGAALRTAFDFARRNSIDILVTIDADGQHDPKYIPILINAIKEVDMVTGTRFHPLSEEKTPIPPLRKRANSILAKLVSEFIASPITDSACGFRVYRNKAIKHLDLTVKGYAWPFQLWIQARNARLKIKEVPISNIYPDFYQDLDQASFRNNLNYCIKILKRESIKCCLKEILRLKVPSIDLVKLAFAYHLPKIDVDQNNNS